jgi:Multicopper oxidase
VAARSSAPSPGTRSGAAAQAGTAGTTELAAFTVNGPAREYWITAEPVEWDIVPTGRDQMMNMPIKGRTKFTAWAYRAWSPHFKEPLGPAKVPGPLLEVGVGETLVVHFRNKLKTPVTMHPHGIFYSNEMDGGYKGRFTDPRRLRAEEPHLHLRLGSETGHRRHLATTTTGRWTRCRCSKACSVR